MKKVGLIKGAIAGYLVLMTVVLTIVWAPSASAGTLINRSDTVTNPTPLATTSHEFIFTTKTTGIIKYITFAFPAGSNVSGATLGSVSGIGAGSLSATSSTVSQYTVTTAVSIGAGAEISVQLQNVVNPSSTGTKSITIRTLNASNSAIDSGAVSVIINSPASISSTVQPVFVLTVSTGSLTFNVDPASSPVATSNLQLTVATNTSSRTGGYTVTERSTGDLTGTAYSSASIPHWTGTAASPTAWNTTTNPNYFGLTRDANPADGGNYFGVTTTAQTVMTGNGPTNGDIQNQTWKVAVDYLTPADTYTTTIYIVGTPSF